MTTHEHLAKIRAKCVELQETAFTDESIAAYRSTIAAIDSWTPYREQESYSNPYPQNNYDEMPKYINEILAAWPEELL